MTPPAVWGGFERMKEGRMNVQPRKFSGQAIQR